MTNITEMPLHSRVWIYQGNREFTQSEIDEITKMSEHFVNQWTAHGKMMKASIEIKYNRFIILMADEEQAMASGCSIDKSVHFMKTIEKQFNLSLFDRTLITYRIGDEFKTFKFEDAGKLFRSGVISITDRFFNNLVNTKSDFDANWETTFQHSWVMRGISN